MPDINYEQEGSDPAIKPFNHEEKEENPNIKNAKMELLARRPCGKDQ